MIFKLYYEADFEPRLAYLSKEGAVFVYGSEIGSPDVSAPLMQFVAKQCPSVKNPCAHLIMAFAVADHMTDERAVEVFDRATELLCCQGHQRFLIRHVREDGGIDYHGVINRVDWRTGRLPTGPFHFARAGIASSRGTAVTRTGEVEPGVHPHMLLSPEQVSRLSPAAVVEKSVHWHLDLRVREMPWILAEEFGLRKACTYSEQGAAINRGEVEGSCLRRARKRVETEARTGDRPLIEYAHVIRPALDQPDWPSRELALRTHRLSLKPIIASGGRDHGKVLGGCIVDLDNQQNRVGLSAFGQAYGLRHIEERTVGAATLVSWCASPEFGAIPRQQTKVAPPSGLEAHRVPLREDYFAYKAAWKRREAASRRQRKKEGEEEARRVADQKKAMIAEAHRHAASVGIKLTRSDKAAVRELINDLSEAANLEGGKDDHAEAKATRLRPLYWREWLTERAAAGYAEASLVLLDLNQRLEAASGSDQNAKVATERESNAIVECQLPESPGDVGPSPLKTMSDGVVPDTRSVPDEVQAETIDWTDGEARWSAAPLQPALVEADHALPQDDVCELLPQRKSAMQRLLDESLDYDQSDTCATGLLGNEAPTQQLSAKPLAPEPEQQDAISEFPRGKHPKLDAYFDAVEGEATAYEQRRLAYVACLDQEVASLLPFLPSAIGLRIARDRSTHAAFLGEQQRDEGMGY